MSSSRVFAFKRDNNDMVLTSYSIKDFQKGLVISSQANAVSIKRGYLRQRKLELSDQNEATRFVKEFLEDADRFLKLQRQDFHLQIPGGNRANPFITMIAAPVLTISLIGLGFWLGASDWNGQTVISSAGDLCGPDGSCATQLPPLPAITRIAPTGTATGASTATGSVSADDFLAGGERP